jgi:simple sugar transport system ATP-binding protein
MTIGDIGVSGVPAAADDARDAPLLRMEAITKAYPGVVANDDVDFDLREGEVHAVLGENGAGKSTLMAILFGLQQPDSGRIVLNGKQISIAAPRDAIQHGIGFVQQHFSLIPTLTVLDNVVLARRFGSGGQSDRRFCLRRLREIESEYGLAVDPAARIEALSIADQQKVELLKALILDPRILILDEPAALLSVDEIRQLNAILRRLAGRGYGVILIGHKLADILSVADRVSVLRRGRSIATLAAADVSPGVLGQLIVGDLKPVPEWSRRRLVDGPPVFAVENFSVVDDRASLVVENVSLSMRSGEILGIAGVAGSGQIELMEALAGVRSTTSGRAVLFDQNIAGWSIAARQARGLAFIPPDRHRDGMVGSLSIAESFVVRPTARHLELSRWGFLRPRAVGRHAQNLVEQFDVRGGGHQALVGTLSGGNQQKVILARELDRHPKVVLCCYPTRGLDFAAASAVHAHLRRICDDGAAVLITSLDLDELFAVCDRTVVMQGGRIRGEVPRGASAADVGLLLSGEALPA